MVPRIKRVQIKNYKSIADVTVDLENFTVLVGHNGAGKSNFIDALYFVHDCLAGPIELAFKSRGGISEVRRKSERRPPNIFFRMIMDLEHNMTADYSFEITAKPPEKFSIKSEKCSIQTFFRQPQTTDFSVKEGKFIKAIPGIRPKVTPDRLALYAASAVDEFRPAYDFLTSMRYYSIEPGKIKEPQKPDAGEYLKPDGSNAAAVLKRLRDETDGKTYSRLCELLMKVVEGVSEVNYKDAGQKETLLFKQDVGKREPWEFDAWNMSDGTLRVLGILLALYQYGHHSVITIEEPEATVHPAAAEVIVQVLMDVSKERQILVTTHSPDILDYEEIKDKHIKLVTMDQGETRISNLAKSSRQAIRKHLYTAGELLRLDELKPDLSKPPKETLQSDLFEKGESLTK